MWRATSNSGMRKSSLAGSVGRVRPTADVGGGAAPLDSPMALAGRCEIVELSVIPRSSCGWAKQIGENGGEAIKPSPPFDVRHGPCSGGAVSGLSSSYLEREVACSWCG